jgi:hypothetical protein
MLVVISPAIFSRLSSNRCFVCVQGTLVWYNTGSLGGGGETRVIARMRLDKDNMQQVGSVARVRCLACECWRLSTRLFQP